MVKRESGQLKLDRRIEARALGYLILYLSSYGELSIKEARRLLSGIRKPGCKTKKIDRGIIDFLLQKWHKYGIIIIKKGKISLNFGNNKT